MVEIDYSVYLVTDQFDFSEDEFLKIIEESLKAGTTVIQIREKTSTTLDFYNLAKKVKQITDKYDVPLIINDRLDIALAVDAAGVHLGQDDMPCKIARCILGPDKIIGISTHTLEESMKAQEDGADYLGVGAVYPTDTKSDATFATDEELKKIQDNIKIPYVAIGGISIENAKETVNKYDFSGVAVVSAIMKSDNPEEATKKLLSEVKK